MNIKAHASKKRKVLFKSQKGYVGTSVGCMKSTRMPKWTEKASNIKKMND